jgi:hypothetical protein
VPKGSLSCSILHANKFAVLETLKSLDVHIPGCYNLIRTDVIGLDLQLSQHPCFVHDVPDLVKDEYSPSKRARLEKKRIVFNLPEKVVKRVTFDLPILTENDSEQSSLKGHLVEVPNEQKQTKEFGSLPIID